jgi:NAD(P)-dependent dehydrogenase (short-subunit alcohol dehydrogenase family)/acyl carrier protein
LANASAPAPAPASPTPAAAAVASVDFEALLLQVVAEKTGYPKEMLSVDMELESGLGIDSIKRVEILSSLQEQLPHLGDMDTAELAQLNTLGQIIELASGTTSASDTTSTTDATAAASGPSANELALEMTRFEVMPETRVAMGIAIGQIRQAAPLYLVGDRTGVAEELSQLLATAGVDCAIREQAPEDARWMVLLTGLNANNDATINALVDINTEAFAQVRRCAATMQGNGHLLVTVQSSGGDFGLSGSSAHQGWDTGIAALAKTAAKEWPDVAVKAIDVAPTDPSPKSIAQELFAELIAGGPEMEVGLQGDDQRITLIARPTVRQAQATELTKDSVVVVSGGARGVTAACLQELLTRKPAKLAILGRTALSEEPAQLASFTTDAQLKQALLAKHTESGQQVTPIELNRQVSHILNLREVRANLAQLKATGSRVIYLATDISNAASVAASIAQVRDELGPINVIVHAAGVLADKEIRKKTDAQFHSVFTTKVSGLQNLLHATQADPLTHLVCFSSVAARMGNKGQVDYAMANEILNRVCQAEQARRGAEFSAKSIGWGPWAGGMVDPALAGHFRAQGVELIPIADGACLFADELEGRNGNCVEIVYGGMPVDGASGGGSGIKTLSIRVHPTSHPQILSHLIQDQPVVPMAMVNEWCLSIATALNAPGASLSVRDLSVLKGIQAENFQGIGDWLDIDCNRNESGDLLDMVVKGADGTVHYQMSIGVDADASQAQTELKPVLKLDKWEWTPKRIYEEFLFHGEKLQVVKQLLGVSEAGCRGLLQMPDETDLRRWRVAMLDGGLQLALLWERKRSGLASLPTKFGRLQWYQAARQEGPVTCDLILQKASKLAATWSIVFTDMEKQIIAKLEDVSIHVLLGKPSASAP